MQNFRKKALALLLLLCTLLSAALLSACGNKEDEFFLKEDMADYMSLSLEDYLNVALTVDGIAEITDADVQKYVMQAYTSYLTSQNKTDTKYDGEIAKGDTVTIWYRGEVNMAAAGETERWVDFIGGCNFYPQSTVGSATAHDLLIGSGSFIGDFEDKLIGLEISESALKTVSDKQNYVGREGLLDVVYVTYSYEYRDANGNRKTGQMYDRMDLRKEGGEYVYGGRYSAALRDALLGSEDDKTYVGDVITTRFSERFDLSGDLVEEDISVFNIRLVSIVKNDTPLKNATDPDVAYTFEVAFPSPYSSNPALAGKTARWYVYATKIVRPRNVTVDENTVLTYEEVSTVLGLDYDDVKPLVTAEEATAAKNSEGTQKELVVKYYKEYVKEYLKANREQQLQANVIDGLWKHIIDKIEIVKWPDGIVERYVDTLYAEAEGGYAEYTATYGQGVYASLEEYVVNNYSDEYFPSTDKVADGFRRMAEDQLKQEMAVHYIAAAQGLSMTRKEQKKYYNEQIDAMVAYYNQYYASDIAAGNVAAFTRDDLVDYGYTKQTVVSNYYYEKVSLALYDGMVENNTITYEIPTSTEGEE